MKEKSEVRSIHGSYPRAIEWEQVQIGDLISITEDDSDGGFEVTTAMLQKRTGAESGWFQVMSIISSKGKVLDGASGMAISTKGCRLLHLGRLVED